jgi:hypothetical protein
VVVQVGLQQGVVVVLAVIEIQYLVNPPGVVDQLKHHCNVLLA